MTPEDTFLYTFLHSQMYRLGMNQRMFHCLILLALGIELEPGTFHQPPQSLLYIPNNNLSKNSFGILSHMVHRLVSLSLQMSNSGIDQHMSCSAWKKDDRIDSLKQLLKHIHRIHSPWIHLDIDQIYKNRF